MVEFARLSGALDGNEALRRRARLAALSLTVLSGEEAISVAVGERIAVRSGRCPGRRLQSWRRAGKLGGVRQAGAGPRLPEPGRHAAHGPSQGRGRHGGLWPQLAVPGTALRRSASVARAETFRGRRHAGHRAGGRALPAAGLQRQAAPDLFRGGGRGHSAPLPAHRRRRRRAISRDPERSRDHVPLPCDRLRPAVARQVLAAARLRERGLPAHDRSLRRHRDGGVARARPGAAGGDGLLDRRPRGAAPGAAPRRSFPGGHRPAVGYACRGGRRHPPARPRACCSVPMCTARRRQRALLPA